MGAQMDDKTRALCRLYRFPPAGTPRMSYTKIAKLVRNKNGKRLTTEGIRQSVLNFNVDKQPRGRKAGWVWDVKARLRKNSADKRRLYILESGLLILDFRL